MACSNSSLPTAAQAMAKGRLAFWAAPWHGCGSVRQRRGSAGCAIGPAAACVVLLAVQAMRVTRGPACRWRQVCQTDRCIALDQFGAEVDVELWQRQPCGHGQTMMMSFGRGTHGSGLFCVARRRGAASATMTNFGATTEMQAVHAYVPLRLWSSAMTFPTCTHASDRPVTGKSRSR